MPSKLSGHATINGALREAGVWRLRLVRQHNPQILQAAAREVVPMAKFIYAAHGYNWNTGRQDAALPWRLRLYILWYGRFPENYCQYD